MKHLYVHVPFCEGKCHYCGFYSVMAEAHLVAVYPELPAIEAHLRATEFSDILSSPLETLYMGGGTPAMLGDDGLKSLSDALHAVFPMEGVRECTVELNPAHATPSLFRVLREMGVNRISVGVQSFCDETLKRVGRKHSAEQAIRAVRMAQEHGFSNTGIDLIAGLPGVTDSEWAETLEKALSLNLCHLSVYALSIEEGTPLACQIKQGILSAPGDDAVLDTLARTEETLGAAGFERYEISNYALAGAVCEHNVGIWRGNDYLGLGPAASSRIRHHRWTNLSCLADYIQNVFQGQLPPVERDALSPEDDAQERVTFALRLKEGFDPYAAVSQYPVLAPRADLWEQRLEDMARKGFVERGGARWRLTLRGREVCDAVIRELF